MRRNLLLSKKIGVYLILLVALLVGAGSVNGATIISVRSGNWNATNTWNSGVVPTSTDIVIIRGGYTVTVNVTNATCSTLQIGGDPTNGNNYGTLAFATTGSPKLIVIGNVQVGGNGQTARTGTITFQSGATLDAASVTLGSNQAKPAAGIITMTNGGTLRTGSLEVNTVTGNTWTYGTGTVVLDTDNTLPATIFTTFYNLTTISGTTTTGANLTINGNLNVSDGSTFTLAGANRLTVAGTTTVGGGTSGTLNISGWSTTEIFTGLVTIKSGGTWNNSANLPVNFRGGITNNGTFSVGTGPQTFDTNAQALTGNINMTGAAVTVTGINLTNNGTLTLNSNFSGTGTLTNASTGTINSTAGLTISNLTNQGTLNASSNNLTPNTLVNTSTGILNISGTTYTNPTTLTNQGTINLTSTGTIGTPTASFTNTGTINLNGTGYITGITNNAGSTANFENTSQTIGTFNNATTTSTLNVNALVADNSFINILTAAVSGNTVTYGGVGNQTIKNTTYSNLKLLGSGTKTAGGAIAVNGTTAINGVTFNSGGFSSSLGILTMGSSSTIALGAGLHTITIANSSSASWTGTLSITGWTGTAGSSGTEGKIVVGVGGLTAAQLVNVSFSGYTTGAQILASGELVPKVSAPALAISGTTNHGSACVGTAAATIQYTITNTGSSTASGVTVNSNDAQFVVSNLSSTTIAGGGNATCDVTFTPNAIGPQSATITVASTTAGSNSPTNSLTGTGNPLPIAAVTPSPVDGVSDVCYSGVGAVNSASWAAVSGATSYDVYFGAGSLPGSVTSNVPTNSFTTGALSANTTYYWKVVPKNACGDATGASTWTFTTASSACLSYCAISATNSRPITRVIFDGINNTSSNVNTVTSSYEDFTSITANVQVGQIYSMTVEGNTWGISSNNNTYYYSVYFDWNQNGSFSDAGESFQVGTLNSSTGVDGQQTTANIAIPISAPLGNTRMRVIGQFGGYNTNFCAISDGTNSYGQAEDYTLNIMSACVTAPVAVCKDITVDLDASGNVIISGNQVNNGSTSPCGNTLSYTVSPSNFTCANLGSNTVTLTVKDDGNSKTATCTATVTVRDVTLPTIADCPANINIEVPFGNSGANVYWTAPTVTDNCGVTTFTSSHTSGDFFNLGSTTVTYTAKDNSLNTAACSFTVTVTMADCNPMGINASGQVDWISKVDIGSFSKTSGASNYSDYTSDVINLDGNTNQTVTLTPGVPASGFVEYWKVWIDLNKDGDYLDPGEELYNGNSVSALTSSFTIPDVTVNTTMRVAMKGIHTDDLTVPGGNVSSQYTDWPNGEDITKLVDNVVNQSNLSKYLTFHASGWVQYQFPLGEKYTVTKYSMTSANDFPERDPLTWNLQGSNDGSSWFTIDSRSNEDFPTRWLKKEYTFTNNIAYGYYRLNMTNNSGTILQLGEWELFEIDDTPYPEPCETFSFGEVEDYTVNIAPACVDGTLSLTSNTGTDAQTVCINTLITSITYAVGGGASGATVTGLPSGVTSSFNAGIVTISGSPGANSTYRITTSGTISPCAEASITGSITVNPLPSVSSATVSPSSVCGAGQVTFSATASSGSIKWYDALTGGNEISVLNPTISSNTTYYAEAISPQGCISAARTGVTATVKALPTVSSATVSPSSVCGAAQVTFSATASSGSIKWYDALTGGNEISLLNPTISSNTTYYAEAISPQGCISAARTGVTATVNTASIIILTSGMQNPTICSGTAISTTVYTFGGSATSASVSGLPNGLAYSVNTTNKTVTISGTPTATGTYTITTGGHTSPCIASSISGTVTVNSVLSVSADPTDITCIGNSNGIITATGSGGQSPYQFKLNSGTYASSNTFSGLAPDNYIVWVKDAIGCEGSTTVNVIQVVSPIDIQTPGDNSWIGYVYDGISFNTYAGYLLQPESFSTNFGGDNDATCIPLFSNGIQDRSILSATFSARFLMNSNKTGLYLVDLNSDDGIRLSLDGNIIFSDWTNHAPRLASDVLVPLSSSNLLALEYYENTGQNQVAYNNIREIQNNLTDYIDQTICEGDPLTAINGTLKLDNGNSLPTGITPSYKWYYQKNPSTQWVEISGANGDSYTPSNSIFEAGTYKVKRVVTITSSNNSGAAGTVTGRIESNEATINVNAKPIPGRFY
ncbi:Ig-like domain-containing protein [Aquipluma nitroreducens]|nr:HYR domain-containing protein [Aquipluma nitroreducens]